MTITIPKIEGEVDISELTTVNSDGVFDKMFGNLRAVLREEYDANRIRGTDYANALVQAFSSTLQMASTYTLSKAKLPFEIQLLEAQLAKTGADVAVATKQGALIDAQASQVMAEINRINSELKYKLPAEVQRIAVDTVNAIKEGQLVEANICKTKEETIRIHADTLLKMPYEIQLLKKQVIEMASQTELTQSQADLYEQKIITEKAQVDENIADPNSAIGLNNQLLTAQIKGFNSDSQLKTASLLIDTWKVRYNADPENTDNVVDDVNKLYDPNIGKAIDQLFTTVGIR